MGQRSSRKEEKNPVAEEAQVALHLIPKQHRLCVKVRSRYPRLLSMCPNCRVLFHRLQLPIFPAYHPQQRPAVAKGIPLCTNRASDIRGSADLTAIQRPKDFYPSEPPSKVRPCLCELVHSQSTQVQYASHGTMWKTLERRKFSMIELTY